MFFLILKSFSLFADSCVIFQVCLFFLCLMTLQNVWLCFLRCFFSNGRTSGIPILGYPTGTLDVSSTNVKCNGNGMHAEISRRKNKRLDKITFEMLVCRRCLLKTYIAYTPSNGTFFACCGCLICLTFDAQIHDVISTNGAIVNHDV